MTRSTFAQGHSEYNRTMNYLVSNDTRNLYRAFLSLKNEEECKKFLRDLLTKAEIQEFSNRLKIAQMLSRQLPYKRIEKETGVSSTTIARISKWLAKGMGGYQLVIDRLSNKSMSSQPSTINKSVAQPTSSSPKGGVIFGA